MWVCCKNSIPLINRKHLKQIFVILNSFTTKEVMMMKKTRFQTCISLKCSLQNNIFSVYNEEWRKLHKKIEDWIKSWYLQSTNLTCFISGAPYTVQNPLFKSFGSSLNSLNAALRTSLRPNSDDSLWSLCHVIDSCEILGST